MADKIKSQTGGKEHEDSFEGDALARKEISDASRKKADGRDAEEFTKFLKRGSGRRDGEQAGSNAESEFGRTSSAHRNPGKGQVGSTPHAGYDTAGVGSQGKHTGGAIPGHSGQTIGTSTFPDPTGYSGTGAKGTLQFSHPWGRGHGAGNIPSTGHDVAGVGSQGKHAGGAIPGHAHGTVSDRVGGEFAQTQTERRQENYGQHDRVSAIQRESESRDAQLRRERERAEKEHVPTAPAARTGGDAILDSVKAQRISPASEEATNVIRNIGMEVAKRILATHEALNAKQEVRITLQDNTEISVTKEGKTLNVNFAPQSEEMAEILNLRSGDLRSQLMERLRDIDQIEVGIEYERPENYQRDGDGRSRGGRDQQQQEEDSEAQQ
jgi:Cu/Ag efflux protein CusF